MAARTPIGQQSPTLVAHRLRESIAKIDRRIRQTRPITDLTIAQISALRSLSSAGALTHRGLADAERVRPPTMTRIVARLEERGLVNRSPHPSDGRQVIIALSPQGKRLLEEYQRVGDEWLTVRVARLSTDDREALAQAAEILVRLAKE